jgi:hypothetical protein
MAKNKPYYYPKHTSAETGSIGKNYDSNPGGMNVTGGSTKVVGTNPKGQHTAVRSSVKTGMPGGGYPDQFMPKSSGWKPGNSKKPMY